MYSLIKTVIIVRVHLLIIVTPGSVCQQLELAYLLVDIDREPQGTRGFPSGGAIKLALDERFVWSFVAVLVWNFTGLA